MNWRNAIQFQKDEGTPALVFQDDGTPVAVFLRAIISASDPIAHVKATGGECKKLLLALSMTIELLEAVEHSPVLENLLRKIADGSPESEIRLVFAEYRDAMLSDNGARASSLVNQATIDMYGEYKEQALLSFRETVDALSLSDKLMVFLLRLRMNADDLRKIDPKGLFEHAVTSGWTGKESLATMELGKITFDGDTALGVMVSRGVVSPYSYRFVRENGDWKVDITATIPIVNSTLAKLAKMRGKSANEFIFDLLNNLELSPDETVWSPLTA